MGDAHSSTRTKAIFLILSGSLTLIIREIMTQIANLVPHTMANIPIPNIDYTCAKYFEEEISKIHHFSQPHNTEFIEKNHILKRVKRRKGWGCPKTGLEVFAIPLFLIYLLIVMNDVTGFFDILG